MFGSVYWGMVFVCIVSVLYMWVWLKEEKVKSRNKTPLSNKLVRWLLFFVPILNGFFAFAFGLLVILTIVSKEVVKESIRQSKTLYFEEEEGC